MIESVIAGGFGALVVGVAIYRACDLKFKIYEAKLIRRNEANNDSDCEKLLEISLDALPGVRRRYYKRLEHNS